MSECATTATSPTVSMLRGNASVRIVVTGCPLASVTTTRCDSRSAVASASGSFFASARGASASPTAPATKARRSIPLDTRLAALEVRLALLEEGVEPLGGVLARACEVEGAPLEVDAGRERRLVGAVDGVLREPH